MTQPLFEFDASSATHPGKVRPRNEDACLMRTDVGLWAVADGMGGHESGDLASQLIVEALDTIAVAGSAVQLLEETESRIVFANRQIVEICRQRGGAVIGSTVAVLLISEQHYACVWAGDSRLYLARADAIQQISRDHTEVEDMVAAGAVTADEAKHLPNNVITKAVGVHDQPELEMVTGALEQNDTFVLCSDGLTKHVADDEILRYVTSHDAKGSCAALVRLALDRGGVDNVTVVVVRLLKLRSQGESATPPTTVQPPVSDVWK